MNRVLSMIVGLTAGYLAFKTTLMWSGYQKTKHYSPSFKQAWHHAEMLPKETAFRKGT